MKVASLQSKETETIVVSVEVNPNKTFNMYAWPFDPNDLQECPEDVELRLIVPFNSGDPNEMHGYIAESGSKHIKKDLTDVYYRIEFENDAEIANADAHTIVITDQIDGDKFDLTSFKPTSVKFGNTCVMLDDVGQSFVKTVDLRESNRSIIAQISLDYNAETGLAVWNMQSLDPYSLELTDGVDNGLLPVNDETGCGQGEVTFDIKLKEGIAHGTEIPAQARIVFDNNDPIDTPVFTNIIDNVVPESQITAIEQISDKKVKLTIMSSDEGSGIWRYDVYCQPGEGAEWEKIAENVENTEAAENFDIEVNASSLINNGFCVIATDAAGNVEQKTLQREDLTVLMFGDTNADGKINITDVVNLVSYINNSIKPEETFNKANADVNGDGSINITDKVKLIEIINNK